MASASQRSCLFANIVPEIRTVFGVTQGAYALGGKFDVFVLEKVLVRYRRNHSVVGHRAGDAGGTTAPAVQAG